MTTAEDCYRMAAQWLGKADSASDPSTSLNMRRASDAWATLAQRIEQAAFTRIQSHIPVRQPADLTHLDNVQIAADIPVRRPADLAKPRSTTHLDSVQIADIPVRRPADLVKPRSTTHLDSVQIADVPVRRPAELVKPRSATHLDSVQIADALRELLHLCDPPSEES